jgi:hypothetical protein
MSESRITPIEITYVDIETLIEKFKTGKTITDKYNASNFLCNVYKLSQEDMSTFIEKALTQDQMVELNDIDYKNLDNLSYEDSCRLYNFIQDVYYSNRSKIIKKYLNKKQTI